MKVIDFPVITGKPWKPKPYQKKGAEWLASRPSAALFWAPGLGKTTTVYEAFMILRAAGLVQRMLILAPLRVIHGVWKQEAEKWDKFSKLKVGIAHGPNRRSELLEYDNDVVLMNYDGILWAADREAPLLEGFDIVVYDEITRMKHTNTRRFKLWKPLLSKFKFRWGLTGTPAPNGMMDLFGQIFVLDGGQRLGPFITKFRFQFFHQKTWDAWNWYPNTGSEKEISRRLRNLAHYIDESDWKKMPDLLDIPVKVTLPPKAMMQYKHLEKAFILKLEQGEVIASNAAVLTSKLRQAASGQIYDEERNVIPIHEEKLNALEDLVEELAKDPVIVSVAFLHEVDAIRKRLGIEIPYLGGGVSGAATTQIISRWNMGWTPILLAHPTSVSHGLNLQSGGRAVIWYSLTWNAEEYYQMIRRVYRQGQTRKVLNYAIMAEGTIDQYVWDTLKDKDATQTAFMKGLKGYYGV